MNAVLKPPSPTPRARSLSEAGAGAGAGPEVGVGPQVVNLDDCLSVNHNWVNSCNLRCAVDQAWPRGPRARARHAPRRGARAVECVRHALQCAAAPDTAVR